MLERANLPYPAYSAERTDAITSDSNQGDQALPAVAVDGGETPVQMLTLHSAAQSLFPTSDGVELLLS